MSLPIRYVINTHEKVHPTLMYRIAFISFVLQDDSASSSSVRVLRLNAKLKSKEVRILTGEVKPRKAWFPLHGKCHDHDTKTKR